jgi:MoaA/NifB/PqqE/SkfB family radical SAM enzyme
MCSLDDNYKNKSVMSQETFDKIIDVVPMLDYIDFDCNAEPFMNKNIFNFVSKVKSVSHKTKVGFPTNGTLLSKRIIENIVLSGIDIIRFSFDGSTKKTFDSIRKNADFDKVIKNIELLNEAKKKFENNNPSIVFVFVAMKKNIFELPNLIDLANKLNVKEICVLGLEPYSSEMSDEIIYHSDIEHYNKYFSLAKEKAVNYGINLQLPSLIPFKKKSCIFKDTLYVSAEGDVVPCPLLSYDRPFYFFGEKMRHKKLFFGNVNKNNLLSIWNSAKYYRFRKKLYENKFHKVCDGCLMNRGLIVPFQESI